MKQNTKIHFYLKPQHNRADNKQNIFQVLIGT